MKAVKGQIVWVINREGTKETTVKSSGSKYITVHLDDRVKYDADTLKQIDGRGWSNYLIVDIEKYKEDAYYNGMINRLSSLIVDIEKYKEDAYYNGMINRLSSLNWDIDRKVLDQVINLLGLRGEKE